MPDRYEAVRALYQNARSLRQPFESIIRDCYRYTIPSREPFASLDAPTPPDRTLLFDTTAQEAVKVLVTTIMTLLIPNSKPWAEIGWSHPELMRRFGGNVELATALRDANDTLQTHLMESTFYLAVQEAMENAVVAGIGCVAVIDEDGRDVGYVAVPADELCFTEDAQGRPDCIFREHSMDRRQLAERGWRDPDDDDDDQNPGKRCTIVECVIPDGDRYRYLVFEGTEWEEPLVEQESPYNPFVLWRINKQLSPWGTSLIADALPNIKTVNKMVEDVIVAADYMSKGLWQSNDDTLNYDQIADLMQPGATIIADGEGLKPLQFPGRLDIPLQVLQDTRNAIRSMLMLRPSRDPNKTPVTAEQVVTDREEFYQRVGPEATRLEIEFLNPVAKQIFRRLRQRGELMPEMDAETSRMLAQSANVPVTDLFEVEVDAAIVRGMAANEAINEIRAAQTLQTVLGNTFFTVVDAEAAGRRWAGMLGIDATILRTPEQVQQLVQQQQQTQQQAQVQQLLGGPAGKQLIDVAGQQLIAQQRP